tara:strand:+ start:268 stop:405 length:138 start_codon:yes stop_codon:yes gene_type:complete
MTCAGKLNFLILEVSPLGSCDKNDSLKAFESVAETTVVVVESVGN